MQFLKTYHLIIQVQLKGGQTAVNYESEYASVNITVHKFHLLPDILRSSIILILKRSH